MFYQLSMCADDPDNLQLAVNSFERCLRDGLTQVVSIDDFAGWYSATTGRPCCGPVTIVGIMLLQARYNLSDPEILSRMLRDRAFRYALRLDGPHQKPPSLTVYRTFRKTLRERMGADFIHNNVLKLASSRGLIPDVELQAQDSSHTRCRGAQLDTFNLIAAAIRAVIREVAHDIGQRPAALAAEWEMSRYLGRSVKGQVEVDWSSEAERNRLLTEEVQDADRLPQLVAAATAAAGAKLSPTVTQAISLAQQVAHQDVERLDDGTYKIKRGTAKGRVVSVSDPEARHGRKSRSKPIVGFKHHVQSTLQSLFVTGIVITDAGAHDSAPSPELLDQSVVVDLKPDEVVGDLAYGTGANIRGCAAKGVAVLTKVSGASRGDCLAKSKFMINLENMAVTCPEGHTTTEHTWVSGGADTEERVANFKFPKATCQACPLAHLCNSQTRKGGRRSVKLSVYEPEFQRMKEFNATPRAKGVLRARSAIERLISHLVRMGLRQAKYFGRINVQYQALMTAAAYNLQRIFTLMVATQPA
ncbi:MAG: transposase [Actinomycetia bacterium]|nr:transposase [Actinomycetes bacterium]